MSTFRVFLLGGSVAALAAASAAVRAAEPDGSEIYLKKCALCHGREGVPPPTFVKLKAATFADPAWHKAKTDDQIRKGIRLGVKGSMMKSFEKELSAAELDALVKYLRTLASAKK